jgi:hypothetical protein
MALQQVPNYSINIPDAGKAFEEGMMWRQQQKQQEAARTEGEAIKKAIADLGPNPTVQSINALIVKYPALAERFKEPLKILSEQERQAKQSQAIPIYGAMMSGKMDTAISMLQEQAAAARNSGNEAGAKSLEDQIKFIQADPAAARTAYGVTMAALMGPDKFQETYNTLQTNLRENELQPDKIAELKAKAIKVAATGGFETHNATTLPNGVTILVGKDGTRQVRDVNGNVIDGTNAALAISQGQDYAVSLEVRKAGGAAAARGAAEAAVAPAIAGGSEAGRTGIQMANDAFTSATKISANQADLRRVRELAASGVDTGVIASRLPNWSAGAIELANMRNQLGLNVISAAKFGALSEGELNLALNTALPTNLDQEDLVKWVDAKMAAQEKLRMEYLKVAKFLSKPGNTLNMYLEQNGITPAPAAPANDLAAAAAAELARRRASGNR